MKLSISNDIVKFKTVEVETVKELAELACKSNISLSVFKDGKRNLDSFISTEMIGLDIDNDKEGTPSISVDEATEIFKNHSHVILATRNHNVEKNGVVAERFRVILFLEYPITSVNDYYATWHKIKDACPWIDSQCKDASRFWYQHKEVLSVQETGASVQVTKYVEPEKKETRPALPGERGTLGKETLKFLEFGVGAGSRNGTTYKVARDFQQNMYTLEETEDRILAALDRNDVLGPDFTEAEARQAIGSAFSKDAKHAPRLEETKPRAFNYTSIGDLINQPDIQLEWIIDGLLFKGGLSIIVGGPKVGKTTLIRQLEKNVLRGESFLGRKVCKGSIMHFSFDEKARTAKEHYLKLGLTKDDPMSLHFGIAGNSNYLKELEEDLLRYKPTLVVIDTLFDMVNADDVNNYAVIKRALSYFNTLAERTNSHIMFIHHQNKPNANFSTSSGHSILGSTAIFGSVDCCIILEQAPNSERRSLAVKGRGVKSTAKIYISFDAVKMVYRLEDGPEDPKDNW
jgi:hypothetical protein